MKHGSLHYLSQPVKDRSLAERSLGRLIGIYRVSRLMGGGAFAWVYEAVDRDLEIPVALKILRPEYAGQADAEARFRREAATAARLRHPNIVTVRDVGQIEGAYVQGAGWLTSEELVWNDQGVLLTHSPDTYKIPAVGDRPLEFHVNLLKDAEQANTLFGSKAVGEPPFMLAISVREAIRDAVAAFGAGKGEVALASPATGEAIWRAIQKVKAPSANIPPEKFQTPSSKPAGALAI